MTHPLLSRAHVGLLLIGLVACGDASAEDGPGGGGSGSGGGAAPVPLLEPSLFDCSRTQDPPRMSPLPPTCAVDPTCKERLVSGHRGAGSIAPEDTVSGVHAAIALGADYVETDPRPTKDGFLVNLHDTSIDRTTLGTGEASELTLAEIQSFAIRPNPGGAPMPGDFSCERVPTLDDILIAARGKVHVLIDANKTDRVDLLVDAIRRTDTLDWAIFDTGSVEKIDQALAMEPSLLTMIRVDDVAELDAELMHFAAHPPVIVEIGSTTPALVERVHALGHRALFDVFVTDFAAGLQGDDVTLYDEVFATGIDIAQSDRPDLVLRWLGRR